MQPDQDKDTWRQPTPQPNQSPYVEPVVEPHTPAAPVVTITPDEQLQPDITLSESQPSQTSPAEPVRWRATEYIQRDKNSLWFVIFGVVTLLLMALAIFLIKSYTFAALIPVMAFALLSYTRRPPREINYTLSNKGLHIDDRLYPFADYKGFGVIRDDGEYSVQLIPIKRFRPGVSVYFPEQAGEAIVDMLGVRLPMQEIHLDAVDKLIRKLRI